MYDDEDNPGLVVLLIGIIVGAFGLGILIAAYFLLRWVFA